MSATAVSPPIPWEAVPEAAPASSHALSLLERGGTGRVVAVRLEDDLARWLAAIGIARGDHVTVLRRAPFGGPIHLRTHTGGEFAVDRAVALHIDVAPARAEAAKDAL